MLTKIQIKNFQILDLLRIVFDPKITVIVGPSDAGKSAIMRAIRWVTDNRPTGDSFVREGSEGGADVEVEVDGVRVRRKKNGTRTNSYWIDGKELKAFKTEVPEEIRNLFRVGPANYQWQNDSWFWFSSNAGDVAKEINTIVDLDIIDSVMGFLSSEARKYKSSMNVSTHRIEEVNEQLEKLEWVSEADKGLQRIEERSVAGEELSEEIQMLEGLAKHASTLTTRINLLNECIDDFKQVGQFLVPASMKDEIGSLLSCVAMATTFRVPEIPDISEMSQTVKQLEQVAVQYNRLRQLVVSSRGHETEIEKHLNDKDRLEDAMSQRFKACPLCGAKL